MKLATFVIAGSCLLPVRALAQSPGAAATPTRILGTSVTLVLPAGYEPSSTFLGGRWPALGAELYIREREVPLSPTQNVTKFGQHDGTLSAGHAGPKSRDKNNSWGALIGDDKRSVELTLVYPQRRERELSDRMQAILRSARWDPALRIDPFELVPWTLTVPTELSFLLTGGLTFPCFYYSETGKSWRTSARGDALLAIEFVRKPKHDAFPAAAEDGVRALIGIARLEFVTEQSTPFDIGSVHGWEVLGALRQQGTPAELFGYVAVLKIDGGQVVVRLQCALANRNTWLPRMQACARSWAAKAPPVPQPKK